MRDKRALDYIVHALQTNQGEFIVEIGPGTGALTMNLLAKQATVYAIEVDPELSNSLDARLLNPPNLRIITADARAIKPSHFIPEGVSYKLTGNLPYYAATPIIRNFLESSVRPDLVITVVQKEVAQNMVAKPPRLNLLAIGTQIYGEVKILKYLKPQSFFPIPKVSSAIISIKPYKYPMVSVEDCKGFFHMVRAGFSSPRKQLHNSIKHSLHISSDQCNSLLSKAQIDPRRRAQSLSIDEWKRLYEIRID
jgi:16S rRNA (adenine1518-N6/adenine1519-N6)-dimethyltransferase